MQRFTDLRVWRLAHAFVLDVYRFTSRFPPDERFGLTSQLRRAAASVPTNLAEGSRRKSRSDYCRFLNIAEASCAETEYLLMLVRDLGYLSEDDAETLLKSNRDVGNMLTALRSSVEQTEAREARETRSR